MVREKELMYGWIGMVNEQACMEDVRAMHLSTCGVCGGGAHQGAAAAGKGECDTPRVPGTWSSRLNDTV